MMNKFNAKHSKNLINNFFKNKEQVEDNHNINIKTNLFHS